MCFFPSSLFLRTRAIQCRRGTPKALQETNGFSLFQSLDEQNGKSKNEAYKGV